MIVDRLFTLHAVGEHLGGEFAVEDAAAAIPPARGIGEQRRLWVPTKLDRQSFSDGILDVVHSSAIGFPMIRQLLSQQLGLGQSSPEWVHFQADELEVELSQVQIIDIDGEHFEAEQLSVQLMESAITFLIPQA